jgi:hypothetical protein
MKLLLATTLLVATGSTIPTVYGDNKGIHQQNDPIRRNVKRKGGGDLFRPEPDAGFEAECLRQDDFQNGTKIITVPGKYKLCEDIVFHPNGPLPGQLPEDGAFVPDYDTYDENAFGLGFFAAICVATSGVEIHLNDFTIEQSAGHALFQRFFAVIELADSPFIRDVGPAQFVADEKPFRAASDVKIIGPGTIGRSSHHGIHGNENSNIRIKNVNFKDFEVAAVSLNNVDNLRITDCTIQQNRQDVPVLGMYSAAYFIRRYAKKLAEENFSMTLRGETVTAQHAYNKLNTAINNVYDDVINGNEGRIDETAHPVEYELFHNMHRVVDGPSYAMVVHGRGPAVGGQGDFISDDHNATSSDIVIRNNIINNIKGWTNEVPAAVEDGVVLNDARGAIFQFVNSIDNSPIAINNDGTYKGNVVADLQIMVAKAIKDDFLADRPKAQTGVNTISDEIINWAESGSDVYVPSYRCNGDSMHHVSKGMIVIRVEDTRGFEIQDNSIRDVTNLSFEPFQNCADFHAGASSENEAEQQAGNVRGISVAAVRGYSRSKEKSLIKGNTVRSVTSDNAKVIIGIDVQGDSKEVLIEGNTVDLNRAADADDRDDQYIALRIRENADTEGRDRIAVGANKFNQEESFERRNFRNLRSDMKKIPGHPDVGGLEWELGGCPFARAQGQVRK